MTLHTLKRKEAAAASQSVIKEKIGRQVDLRAFTFEVHPWRLRWNNTHNKKKENSRAELFCIDSVSIRYSLWDSGADVDVILTTLFLHPLYHALVNFESEDAPSKCRPHPQNWQGRARGDGERAWPSEVVDWNDSDNSKSRQTMTSLIRFSVESVAVYETAPTANEFIAKLMESLLVNKKKMFCIWAENYGERHGATSRWRSNASIGPSSNAPTTSHFLVIVNGVGGWKHGS